MRLPKITVDEAKVGLINIAGLVALVLLILMMITLSAAFLKWSWLTLTA